MDDLIEISSLLISRAPRDFRRSLYERIDWTNPLIGIKGPRGTGKTTMLLQWLHSLGRPQREAAYFSLDELYFTTHSLADTGKTFYQKGGKILVLDEVHKYLTWAAEVKNLHDRYQDLQIVFTGSSILEISRHEADLSRRAILYELHGLSYREYLQYQHNIALPPLKLTEILSGSRNLFPQSFKPLAYFQDYLRHGYYPFFQKDVPGYHQRLRQLVRTIIEFDMAELKGFDIRHAKKMLQLIYVIAQQVPFKPNITNLAQKTGIHRNSISNYLYFLHEARMIHMLYPSGISVATLQKPEKIYLENTNLLFALSENLPSPGTVREIFFYNQLNVLHKVRQSKATDFEVDNKLSFEVGGKHKQGAQISGLQNAWIVKDDLEYPVQRSIPLWLFGFLY